MTIGEKIKSLRRAADVTQEKLAEYLHVSYQAVSKWENNTAQPDISFVVPLANFFGITTDELFGMNGEAERELAEYEKQVSAFFHDGDMRSALALCREVTAKYPKDYSWLQKLAFCLYNVAVRAPGFTQEESEEATPEAVALCRRILEDCTNDYTRSACRQYLVRIYDRQRKPEEALQEAKQASNMYLSRQVLSDLIYSHNEETARINAENILQFTGLLTDALTRYDEADTPEMIIRKAEAALRVWSAVVDDGVYLIHGVDIAHLYYAMAVAYARLGNREKTLENVRMAMTLSKERDSLPAGELSYTGFFIGKVTCDPGNHMKNYPGTEVENMTREFLTNDVFRDMRDDPAFRALLA